MIGSHVKKVSLAEAPSYITTEADSRYTPVFFKNAIPPNASFKELAQFNIEVAGGIRTCPAKISPNSVAFSPDKLKSASSTRLLMKALDIAPDSFFLPIEGTLEQIESVREIWKEEGIDRTEIISGYEVVYHAVGSRITLNIGSHPVDFDALTFQKPQDVLLSDEEFENEQLFIIANKAMILDFATRHRMRGVYLSHHLQLHEGLGGFPPFYIPRHLGKEYQLARSLVFMTSNKTFMNFSRKSAGDLCLGTGVFKVTTRAFYLEKNRELASPTMLVAPSETRKGDSVLCQAEINNLVQVQGDLDFAQYEDHLMYFSGKEKKRKVRLYLERLEGPELFEIVMGPRRINIDTKIFLTQELVRMIQKLHKKNLCHLDIKPENFRLKKMEKNSPIKFFDLASLSTPGHIKKMSGTPAFWSPEYTRALDLPKESLRTAYLNTLDLKKVDTFALGIFLAYITDGTVGPYSPFVEEMLEDYEVFQRGSAASMVARRGYRRDLPRPTDPLQELIWKMTRANPNDRIDTEETSRLLKTLDLRKIFQDRILHSSAIARSNLP